MFDNIDLNQAAIHSTEECHDAARLRQALAIIKARLLRHNTDSNKANLGPLTVMISHLGIQAQDEPIGAADPTFISDQGFDETTTPHHSPDQAIAAAGNAMTTSPLYIEDLDG